MQAGDLNRMPHRQPRFLPLTAWLCLLTFALPAIAVPPKPTPQPVTTNVAPKPEPTKTAVNDAPLTSLLDLSPDEPASREIAFDVARSLRRSTQVRYRDLDEVLNVGAEDTQIASVRSGDGLIKSGKTKLRDGQYDAAIEDFDAAVESYLTGYALLPDLTVLPRAIALEGVAQLLSGDEAKAATTFARSVQADLKYEQDFTEYPQKVQTAYDTARQAVLARPKIEYEVRTTPPNARVYVNGVFQGLSPVWVKTRVGEQFVTLSKHGSARKAKIFNLELQKDPPPLEEELPKARRQAAYESVIERLGEIFDGSVEPSDLTEAQGLCGATYAVALRATGTRDKMKVELALANLAGRQVVNRLTREIKWQKRDKELIDKLVDELFRIPELPAAEVPAPIGGSTPVYKTWWFWTVIGAVVVGSATAVVLATRKSTPTPPKYAPGHGGLVIQF